IEAGSTPGASNLANFSTGSALTEFVAGGVPAGVYYVRARAGTAAGQTRPSDESVIVRPRTKLSGIRRPPPAMVSARFDASSHAAKMSARRANSATDSVSGRLLPSRPAAATARPARAASV